MPETPVSPFLELRGEAYFLAGSRISLDSIAYAVRAGKTADEILADFPALKSPGKLESAVAFIAAHPKRVEAYLEQRAQVWEGARKRNPPELVEKVRKYRAERHVEPD